MAKGERSGFVMKRCVTHSILILFLSGCVNLAPSPIVPSALYDRVAESFLMVAREDVAENGETTWSQASGCAVEEDGRHYLYTARHVVFDKTNYDALPNKLYATTLQGESNTIDFSKLEVPDGNHDAVRIELQKPICRELRLANRNLDMAKHCSCSVTHEVQA